MMRGNGSLVSRSRKTSHSCFCRHNDDKESAEKECLEVSSGEESFVHRSLETIHTSSSNSGGPGRRSIMIRKSDFSNCGGYVDIGGSRSQDTSHSSSLDRGTRVHVEGRGGYRSPTRHHYPPNQGERVVLLNISGDNVDGHGRVRYRSQTNHYSPQRGDSENF